MPARLGPARPGQCGRSAPLREPGGQALADSPVNADTRPGPAGSEPDSDESGTGRASLRGACTGAWLALSRHRAGRVVERSHPRLGRCALGAAAPGGGAAADMDLVAGQAQFSGGPAPPTYSGLAPRHGSYSYDGLWRGSFSYDGLLITMRSTTSELAETRDGSGSGADSERPSHCRQLEAGPERWAGP